MKSTEEYVALAEEELNNEKNANESAAHRSTILARGQIYATLALAATQREQ